MDKKIIEEIEKIEDKKEKRKKSLRTKITVPVVAIIVAAVLALGIVGSYMSYSSAVSCLEDSMAAAVDLGQEAISNKLGKLNAFASEVAANHTIFSPDVSLEEKSAFLSQKAAESGYLDAYILSSSGKDIVSGADYSNAEYFSAAIKGNSFLTSPYVDKESGKLVMTLAAPIHSDGTSGSSVIGVLCFTVPQSLINETIEKLHISDKGAAYIIDKDGYTIADPDVQLVADKENIEEIAKTDSSTSSLAALHTKARAGSAGFGQYTYKGVKKFLAYAPIDGSNGWIMCILAPVSDFTGGAKTTVYISIALMVLFIAVGIFGSIYIANRVVNPISVFVGRLSKLSEGDVTSPMPEFDAVSSEFHILKSALDTTIKNTSLVITDIDYLLTQISSGNLDIFSRCPERYVGDYRHILTALRRLKKGLTESFGNILSVSEQVSAGASQVSSGAQTLAQGATEQASSIEELSASITEITQHVMDNANDASRASHLTHEGREIMESSVREMELARQAMEEISVTSKNISKVIKAIDDIAFQTNILALNAAVEAARAGAAGKGFAVVADEVRNLSQKSAEAAKNTTALIESSIQAVEKGTAIVNKTSEGFSIVAQKAAESSVLVEEIASKAQQQAAAISQIKIGIEQVSSVVQMNSATSEESAAASEELSSQADVLKNLVSQFKLATAFSADD